jgi:hypothetical protein
VRTLAAQKSTDSLHEEDENIRQVEDVENLCCTKHDAFKREVISRMPP